VLDFLHPKFFYDEEVSTLKVCFFNPYENEEFSIKVLNNKKDQASENTYNNFLEIPLSPGNYEVKIYPKNDDFIRKNFWYRVLSYMKSKYSIFKGISLPYGNFEIDLSIQNQVTPINPIGMTRKKEIYLNWFPVKGAKKIHSKYNQSKK